jgi:predicted metal-dependent phosphotriesterase family hydrolase
MVSANWNMRMCYMEWFNRDELLVYAEKDGKRTLDIGVSTLVDVTPVCLGRDTATVRETARRTGMQIICATGFCFTENQWMYNRCTDSFLYWLMKDIEEGMDGTGVLQGIIKCMHGQRGHDRSQREAYHRFGHGGKAKRAARFHPRVLSQRQCPAAAGHAGKAWRAPVPCGGRPLR